MATTIWDAMRYGWQPNYWLQIAGVPVCWIEKPTSQTLPTGYSADAYGSLVIDQSAAIGSQVNRETGTANSLPFTFRLLDNVTTRTWLQKWSKDFVLTADATAAATAFTVDDSAGWSDGDYFFCGGERIQIGTVASGTSLTGCTRAQTGTLAAIHKAGGGGQLCTDKPRSLKGREVILWASPLDPSGYPTGSLQGDATMVWRGRVADVRRVANGFEVECQSLDRVIDSPLGGRLTGTVQSSKKMYPVLSSWWMSLHLLGTNSAGTVVLDQVLKIEPFTSYTSGTLVYAAELKAAIVTAWAAAVTAAGVGTYVGDLTWPAGLDYEAGAAYLGVHVKSLTGLKLLDFTVNGTPGWADKVAMYASPAGNPDTVYFWNTFNPCAQQGVGDTTGNVSDTLTIKLDTDPAQAPAASTANPGRLNLKLKSGTHSYTYLTSTAADGVVYLAQVSPASAGAPKPSTVPDLVGASAELVVSSTGSIADLVRRCLESSGTASLRGTYDTLAQGAGYGLASAVVHEDSFAKLLGEGAIGKLQATTTTAGTGLADLYGGLLGLCRRAIVMRSDTQASYRALKLTCVRTFVGGSDWQTQISDADLLSINGEPVASVRKLEAPNAIKVTRAVEADDGDEDVIYFNDLPSIDAEGARAAEFAVPCDDLQALYDLAKGAATALFGIDQTVQAIELRVPPWIQAEIGDAVKLSLTHPTIWSWASGAVGVTGVGRVTGRTLELKTGIVRLTILCDGNVVSHALAPAMKVSAHGGTGANPSSVTVPDKYWPHLSKALSLAGGAIYLFAYDPGTAEGTTRYLQCSAVAAPSGGNIVLTTSGLSGGAVTDGVTYLTLPTSSPSGATITSYQADFAHDADGTYWT